MKRQVLVAILISLSVVINAFAQSGKKENKKVKNDKWKYVGASVYDTRKNIKVDSYFNKNRVEKNEQTVKFQIKEKPEIPQLFFRTVFTRLYEFNPEKYKSFTHLITYFEGHCLEKTLKVNKQEVWGTENPDEPIITFTVKRELKRVKPGSSKEKDLLLACRQ